MPRSLSPSAIAAIQATTSAVVFHSLVTIEHPSFLTPIYICDNKIPVVSRGITYQPVAFTMSLPDDSSDSIPSVSITIDNVSQEIMLAIRNLFTPPMFKVEIVTSENPGIVELSLTDMIMRNVGWTETQISADLVYNDVLNQRWPDISYTPSEFQALFS